MTYTPTNPDQNDLKMQARHTRRVRRERTTPPPDLYSNYFQGPDKHGQVQFMIWCNSCNEEVDAEVLYVNCKCFHRQSWKNHISPVDAPKQTQNSTPLHFRPQPQHWAYNFIYNVTIDRLTRFLLEIMCFFLITVVLFETCMYFTGEPFAAFLSRISMKSNSSASVQAPLPCLPNELPF